MQQKLYTRRLCLHRRRLPCFDPPPSLNLSKKEKLSSQRYNRDPSSPSARGKKSQVERHQGRIAPLCVSHSTVRLSVGRHAGCVRVRLQRRKRSLFLQDEMRACRGREEEEGEREHMNVAYCHPTESPISFSLFQQTFPNVSY